MFGMQLCSSEDPHISEERVKSRVALLGVLRCKAVEYSLIHQTVYDHFLVLLSDDV